MNDKKNKLRFFNIKTLTIACVLLILLSAIALLWHGNANSNQAVPALLAQVYFDGEYQIADGEWQKIEKGNHISSTEGDVTLRGNFHMLTPDGEYVGLYDGDMPIAFYINHISVTVCEGENEPFVFDMENSLFGDSACGVGWIAYSIVNSADEPLELIIHNPHKFGNKTAVDELLNNTALWAGLDFEKEVLESGESQREIGLLFIIVSLLILGIALFSTLIHENNGKIIWLIGFVVLFAGTYLSYSADGVSFWSESIVSNTVILGCSMMLYMLFLSMALVWLLKGTRKIGAITVGVLGFINIIFFILPILTDVLFYDTLLYWSLLQILVNIILTICLIREFFVSKGKERVLYICSILPLISFVVDFVMIGLGIHNYYLSSKYIFIIFFIVAIFAVLKLFPATSIKLLRQKNLKRKK